MKELLQRFRLVSVAPPNAYCVLCLRTEAKRKLIEKNSLYALLTALSDEEVWPWKHADHKKLKVCFICEARLVAALKVIELVRCGVMADRMLQCYKKKELAGIESRNHTIEHPLKHALTACNTRFKMAAMVSNVFLTEALAIHVKGNMSPNCNPLPPPPPPDLLDEPVSTNTTRSFLPTKQVSSSSQTPNKQPNINHGASKTVVTTGVSAPGLTGPSLTVVGNPGNVGNPAVVGNPALAGLELPSTTETGLTTNYTLPLPQPVTPQCIKLSNTLTIYNTGKYLALKTPGESVVLHPIFQGPDAKSYVPTLSVMIEEGKLLPMPDFGLRKETTGNSLPEMGISLPGLETILSEKNQPIKNLNQKKPAFKPDWLKVPHIPTESSPKTNNRHLMQNSHNFNAINPKFGSLQFDAKNLVPLNDAKPKPRMLTIDATVDLDNESCSEVQAPLDFEHLIDVLEEHPVSMEDDPLEQAEIAVPVPIKTESDTDTEPVSQPWIPNAEANQRKSRLDFNYERISYEDDLKPLSNVDKALIRLDILNNYRQPIVLLKHMKIHNNTKSIKMEAKLKRIQNNNQRNKNSLFRAFTQNEDSQLLTIASKKPRSVTKAKRPDTAYSNTVLINQILADRARESAIRLARPLESRSSYTINMKGEIDTTVISSDTESETETKEIPVQNVVKCPKMKDGYNMDWEDKIPMDVITYMDATDPASQRQQPAPSSGAVTSAGGGGPLAVIVRAYSEREDFCIDLDD